MSALTQSGLILYWQGYWSTSIHALMYCTGLKQGRYTVSLSLHKLAPAIRDFFLAFNLSFVFKYKSLQ